MILADIGNTHFHIYDGKMVEHLVYADAIRKYKDKELLYITVNQEHSKEIASISLWKNIACQIHLEGTYETMGVDRKALCCSHRNGLFVDAGSAITVDIVEDGIYKGGFILPGLKAYLHAYQSISKVLDVNLNKKLDLDILPRATDDGISYGIIASIKALIDKHSTGKTLYFTGGDGRFLSQYFNGAIYSEKIVFEGMQKVLKDK